MRERELTVEIVELRLNHGLQKFISVVITMLFRVSGSMFRTKQMSYANSVPIRTDRHVPNFNETM